MNHELKILSTGLYPACECSCGKFGYVFTHKPGDTGASKREMLEKWHAEHVAEQTQEQPHECCR